MAGTLTPTPYQTVLDGDGVAVSGAKIYTYEAGTTTNATTYTTSDLSVANANPIVADSAGRYVAYLSAGANMRFIIKTSADVTIDDQDNVLSVPGASVNLDVEGTVGEAVTAGQVLYLSSASEASPLTAGLWYLTDADAAPTSTSPQSIGVAVSAIAINTSGTIRLAGLVTTAGAVVVGTTYYVSATAGALASSAPALSRQVGVAMTTSSLLLAATTAVASLLPNPITQDLLFTDNTYDIGKSGASRPRDLFASRNAVIDGTVTLSGGLNTPLVASQGGTGIASYTTNDFLRASGSTALAATAASAVFPYVSPLTTRGDTLVGTSGVATGTRLAVGGANTFLSSDGTDVSWIYIPRVLDSRTGTPFGYTDADTAEKVIWSATIPAGTLATNGDVLEFSCAGLTLATAANHQLFVRVSGTKIFSTQDVDLGDCSWVMRGTIVRQTSVYGQLMVHYDQSTAVDNVRCKEDNIAATTWADAQTFEISAQNGASVQYGIQIRVAQITYFPAAI
jgi:hypothetical protein